MNVIKIEQVFIITSTALDLTRVPLVHGVPQVNSIYIFDVDRIKSGAKWTQK